ncbi:MAG: DUF1186 domain-containing protein [Prochlorotrichaceae cyanobacterium]
MNENQKMKLKDKLFNHDEGVIDCAKPETWPNYVQHLELTEEDIPELIYFATIDNEDDEMYFERIFACRALGQLKALSAVAPLISFLEAIPSYDDWAYEEIPIVFSLMGPETKPIVQDYITNTKNRLSVRISFSSYFRYLVRYYPEQRESVINFFVEQLAKPATSQDDRTLNGFFISELCDLKAIEVAKEIEQAFVHQRVDLSVIGDWDDAQVYLGLKPRTEIPLDRLIFSKKLDRQPLKESQTKGFGDRSETKNSKSKKRKKR